MGKSQEDLELHQLPSLRLINTIGHILPLFFVSLSTGSHLGPPQAPHKSPVHLSRENETMFLPIDFLFSFYNCCHKA